MSLLWTWFFVIPGKCRRSFGKCWSALLCSGVHSSFPIEGSSMNWLCGSLFHRWRRKQRGLWRWSNEAWHRRIRRILKFLRRGMTCAYEDLFDSPTSTQEGDHIFPQKCWDICVQPSNTNSQWGEIHCRGFSCVFFPSERISCKVSWGQPHRVVKTCNAFVQVWAEPVFWAPCSLRYVPQMGFPWSSSFMLVALYLVILFDAQVVNTSYCQE